MDWTVWGLGTGRSRDLLFGPAVAPSQPPVHLVVLFGTSAEIHSVICWAAFVVTIGQVSDTKGTLIKFEECLLTVRSVIFVFLLAV